jgi:hypothetical protein
LNGFSPDEALIMTADSKNLMVVSESSSGVVMGGSDAGVFNAIKAATEVLSGINVIKRTDFLTRIANIPTQQFVDDLESYLGLHTVQQILRSMGLISARSWSEVKALVSGGVRSKPELKIKLADAVVMQQACDLKAVAYNVIKPSDVASVEAAIKSISVPPTSMANAYPLRLSVEQLLQDDGELKPIYTFDDEFGCGVVLGRKRVFTISEDISYDKFDDSLRQQFPNAEKIVAVSSISRQTFDVLYLNKSSMLLEMRADVMRDATLMQTSKQIEKSNNDLRAFAIRLLSSKVQGLVIDSPINMFPLTSKVYADPSGTIKKLGFATDTDSVKRETMKAGVDLRQELFHKNGAHAIDHKMRIFEIAIQWHGSEVVGGVAGSKPEIHIPGTYRDYVSLNPRTDYLVVKGVRTFADADFIVKKINSYRS